MTESTDAPVPQKRVPMIITKDRVNCILNGRQAGFHLNTEQGKRMVELLQADPQDIEAIAELADVRLWITKRSHGRVTVDEKEQLRLDGKPIDYGLTGRVSLLVAQGHSFVALANFVERLSRNPDKTVAEDLYRFIEKGGMPFDDDGYIYAFKKVDKNYNSYYSSAEKVNYTPGTSPSMPRDQCDPNRQRTCSRGLHACSSEYLNFWYRQQGVVVLVRIDPEHVTAIPADHNDQKLRCCQMDVISEIPEEEAAKFFPSVVENRYKAPEPEAPGEPEEPVVVVEETTPVSNAEWAKRGYEAGEQAANDDLDAENEYAPYFDVAPDEISDNPTARAIYTKTFLEGYDTTYRAGADKGDEDLEIPDEED